MIQLLKHFAFRVWATLFFGGILSIAFVEAWQPAMALKALIVPVAAAFALAFFLTGWISSRYGARQVDRLRNEASVWERAGRAGEAEAVFEKTLAVCDSFLLSPRMHKKESRALIAQMARFYLARADKDADNETFVLSYLGTQPQDSDVAEDWLRQMGRYQLIEKKYQEIADRIGNALPENIHVQQLLATLYLAANRNDFPAQQVYRRALSAGGKVSAGIAGELAAIFLREGRADEWALDIYLKALQSDRDDQLLKGIAACLYWIPQTERTDPLLRQARMLLAGMSEAGLKQMRVGFVPPSRSAPPREKVARRRIQSPLATGATGWRWGRALLQQVRLMAAVGIRSGTRLAAFFRSSQTARDWAKWSFVGLLAAGLIVFLVNTVGHFVEGGGDTGQKKAVEAVITDPFTLQVAAYLKPEHARQYVAFLKKQNVNAFWTEAPGKNKKWYQVRVSHFPDKKSAIAYGEELKSKGYINDFFIANY